MSMKSALYRSTICCPLGGYFYENVNFRKKIGKLACFGGCSDAENEFCLEVNLALLRELRMLSLFYE